MLIYFVYSIIYFHTFFVICFGSSSATAVSFPAEAAILSVSLTSAWTMDLTESLSSLTFSLRSILIALLSPSIEGFRLRLGVAFAKSGWTLRWPCTTKQIIKVFYDFYYMTLTLNGSINCLSFLLDGPILNLLPRRTIPRKMTMRVILPNSLEDSRIYAFSSVCTAPLSWLKFSVVLQNITRNYLKQSAGKCMSKQTINILLLLWR